MTKHFKILEFALSSLLRRRYKNLGLILVFSIVVFVISSILLLTQAFKREALFILKGSPELIVQRIKAGRHDLIPEDYIKKIKQLPGVGEVIPRVWGYYYDQFNGANYTMVGISNTYQDLQMLKGEMIREGEKGVCVIGAGIQDARLVELNDSLFLTTYDRTLKSYRIKGIFRAESSLITNDLIIMSDEDIRSFFGIPRGMATDLVVQVYNPTEVSNIARKIVNLLPDTRPITRDEIIRTYTTVFNWRSGLILTMFAGAVLAFVILAWDKATGLSAEERREIGILKAIGWETSDILELKFWEGAVIAVISFLTGLIASYIHVFFFGASLLGPALKGWSVLFPDFRITPYISLYQVSVIASLTIIPYIAATVVPSWKAAVTDPDVVMRG